MLCLGGCVPPKDIRICVAGLGARRGFILVSVVE